MLKVAPDVGEIPFSTIKAYCNAKYLPYPMVEVARVSSETYLTSQQFTFWDDIAVYLPPEAKVSKGFVRPEDHAFNGLTKLSTLNSSFDFSGIAYSRKSSSATASSTSVGSSFFSKTAVTESSDSSQVDSVTRSHPSLNGKFGDYYLHQFDYEQVKSALSIYGISWDLPFEDDYQKGLVLDIDVSRCEQSPTDLLTLVNTIWGLNSYLNVKEATLSGTTITVRFVDSQISHLGGEFAITNVSTLSNVSDCFSNRAVSKIYENLKKNGYGNLDELVPAAALRGLPKAERRKGTALAVALKDSLVELLGGSEGIISLLQGSTNEYLMGIINGLLAANSVILDELERVGGGSVRRKATEAFESGVNSSTLSKNVLSLLNNGMELNNSTAKSLLKPEPSAVITANASEISEALDKSRTQLAAYTANNLG